MIMRLPLKGGLYISFGQISKLIGKLTYIHVQLLTKPQEYYDNSVSYTFPSLHKSIWTWGQISVTLVTNTHRGYCKCTGISWQLWMTLVKNTHISLWDPESTQFQCYSGPSPQDWRTLIHFNVVLTVFHIDQGVCKTVRTTFWCIIVLQSRGEGPEKAHNYGTDSRQIFRTFSPQLENSDTLKCSSDSFSHTLRYVVNVENCQNYIDMYQYPPNPGRRS